jgi:hypothetical protein
MNVPSPIPANVQFLGKVSDTAIRVRMASDIYQALPSGFERVIGRLKARDPMVIGIDISGFQASPDPLATASGWLLTNPGESKIAWFVYLLSYDSSVQLPTFILDVPFGWILPAPATAPAATVRSVSVIPTELLKHARKAPVTEEEFFRDVDVSKVNVSQVKA